MIEIRTATEEDMLAFYGSHERRIIAAYVVMYKGAVGSISGIFIDNKRAVFFSDIKEGVDAPKLTIWRASLEVVSRIKTLGISAIAITNCDKPNAERFLYSLGFVLLREIDGEKQYRLTDGI